MNRELALLQQETIRSQQNPLIKQVLAWKKNRRRKEQKLVWIEQLRHLERYHRLHQDQTIELLLVSSSWLQSKEFSLHRRLLEELRVERTALVDQDLLSSLSHKKGQAAPILAFAPFQGSTLEDLGRAASKDSSSQDSSSQDSSRLYVALDAVEKPGNIGAALRNCDGAGVDGVILTRETKDPLPDLGHPSILQNSMGALFSLPLATCTYQELHTWLKEQQIHLVLADAGGDSSYDAPYQERSCLLFGREDRGLAPFWRALSPSEAQVRSIPMAGINDSLNISCSVALFVYAASRLRRQEVSL